MLPTRQIHEPPPPQEGSLNVSIRLSMSSNVKFLSLIHKVQVMVMLFVVWIHQLLQMRFSNTKKRLIKASSIMKEEMLLPAMIFILFSQPTKHALSNHWKTLELYMGETGMTTLEFLPAECL